MFAFFLGRRGPSCMRRQPTKRRLRVEALEYRTVPTAMGISLQAQTADAQNVFVSGEVMFDNAPSTCSIVLGGEVNASLSTDDYGNFEYDGPAAGLGLITAQATDSAGDQVVASSEVTDTPPEINNLGIEPTGQGNQVEITGSVTAGDFAGLTVDFSGSVGVATTSTTADANGDFDLLTTASSLGNLTATATDVWGTQSSPWSTMFSVPPPQLSQLTIVDMGNGVWELSGIVSGMDLADDTIQFSGIASGTATVNEDGSFATELLMNGQNPSGDEYAVATDIWRQQSNQVVAMFM